MADLDHESCRAGHVEAEHPVVVVATEAVGDGEARCPCSVEGGSDIVGAVGFEHDMVQRLRRFELGLASATLWCRSLQW